MQNHLTLANNWLEHDKPVTCKRSSMIQTYHCQFSGGHSSLFSYLLFWSLSLHIVPEKHLGMHVWAPSHPFPPYTATRIALLIFFFLFYKLDGILCTRSTWKGII